MATADAHPARGDPPSPDLTDLRRALRGDLVLPDDPGYDAARLVANSRFDGARPVAVAEVADGEDVRAVVDFARDRGLRPIPRGGGHSFAGYSTGDGLVVDLGRLDTVEVDAAAGRARVGAGSTLLPTYRALWTHGMAICGGTCPTVGVTGLASAGGLGVLSRRHGLTCDRLIEVEMVTADGELRRASRSENEDLLWATRGGGGGNFGVITALTFEPVPVDSPFTHAHYAFPWSAAERVIAAWQEWLPGSPRETWSCVEVLTQAPADGAEPTIELEVVHAGGEPATRRVVADLLGAIGAGPLRSEVHSGPFVDVEYDFFCKGLRPQEVALAGRTADGAVPRPAFYAKSDIARGPWSSEGLRVLLDGVGGRQRDPILTPRDFSPAHTIGKLILEAADGAVNAISPHATAFAHRDNLFVVQYQARWRDDAPREVVDANIAWVDDLYQRTEAYRSGSAYQAYIDSSLAGWEHAYYGANLARLRRVKAKHDPGDLFRFAQSIAPARSEGA